MSKSRTRNFCTQLIEILPKSLPEKIGIGGASGLGSIIYCLVKISQYPKEPTFLKDARRAANLITGFPVP